MTPTAVKPEAFEPLRAQLRGTLVLQNDPDYDQVRSVWNSMIDRRPAAVARCLGVADVVACVNFAREHGITPSIRGGGHNVAGLALCDGGLCIDMSGMRGVWVDPEARAARVQAGCLLGDVDRETQIHGLAAVLGFVSNTGIAGLTVGGGFGYLTRRFGWTCDNVLSMEVVTADGAVVRASESDNADLFWGLRGGGGNFGVVTGFEYALYPVGPEIVGGAIAWSGDEAGAVLEMYRDVIEHAPPELTVAVGLRLAPPAPWLAPEIHGKPIVAFFVCHTGPVEQAEKDVAAIKAFGRPVGDIVERRSYVSQQNLLDATQPAGRRNYWKSEYMPAMERDFLAKAFEHATRVPSPHSAVLAMPLDGALNRLPEKHSPAGNRGARYIFNVAASWEGAGEDAACVAWARAAWSDLKAFSTGGVYVNFLTEDEGDDRVRAAYGDNYDRLVEVKTAWDPTNLFRTNKNIAPRNQ